MTGTQPDTARTPVLASPQSSSTVSMPHWFDDLCKRLVTDRKVSRRNLLRGVLAIQTVAHAMLFCRKSAAGSGNAPRR